MGLPTSLFRHLGTREGEGDTMPARVSALVTKEEERSERLIGWVQLAIVTTFAVLYFVTPRPIDAMDDLFEPVPIALELYLVFTVIRLIAAYRGFLPGWLLVFSMVADVVLLYALIWSFHIAYDQPAAFYLKAPTFAYIFVFIAVRALRFDPRFVISQGLFAAVGWLVMVLYAIEESGMDVITRSFTAYLTDNLILVGAEFDKVFTLLLCTGVLALALYRGRRLLLQAVQSEAAAKDISRFLGRGVAEAITRDERVAFAGNAVAREAAVVMLDLRGFTAFAGRETPEEVVRWLTRYHEMVLPIVESHGGVVDKFLGDGVMATFGAVKPSPCPAKDALEALSAVMAVGPAWEAALKRAGHKPITINGAAASGRLLATMLGNEDRLEFTVIGSAANLAAKLEKHNKAVGTRALTDMATFAQARSEGFRGKGASIGPSNVGPGGAIELVQIG
ncbi:MAG: adenylate/guanylate cyclase domain-containing protein [Pseudomonadota bacterium]